MRRLALLLGVLASLALPLASAQVESELLTDVEAAQVTGIVKLFDQTALQLTVGNRNYQLTPTVTVIWANGSGASLGNLEPGIRVELSVTDGAPADLPRVTRVVLTPL